MLPQPWAHLGAETRELMLAAYEDVCGGDDAERLRLVLRDPRELTRGDSTRQAQHARMHRMLTSALAAVTAVSLVDEDVRRLFQREDFAGLRPNRSAAHVRFGSMLAERRVETRHLEMTWTSQVAELRARAARVGTLDPSQLSVLHATFVPLFASAIVGRGALRDAWRELWVDARRRGITPDNPGMTVHLAGIGCFVGENEAEFEVCAHPALRQADFCSALCLARRDYLPGLLAIIAASLHGEVVSPSECLHPGRPTSTVASLANYVRGLMRQPQHFHTEGLILALLRWVSDLSSYVNLHGAEWEADISSLLREFQRIERVQVLEKSRFWTVLDRMPPGPKRELLASLWTRAAAPPAARGPYAPP